MNCIIPGLNLKVLAKALHALAKVGDELFIEAGKDKLTLVALNLRKTVCVRFYFLESFFSNYEVNESGFNEEKEAVTCKVQMKVLLPLFKGANLEKKIDFIKIAYENNSDIITFKMKYNCDDIIMTHKLRLMETESLTIQISTDSGSNNMLATSSFFNQLLAMFSTSDDEITLEISKEKVIARNYVAGAPIRPKCVRSQVNLIASEFSMFQIRNETSINFSLKPFRTAIQFAEGFNLNIGCNFDCGGKPLALIMKNPTFEVHFIVATLNPYSDLQSTMTTSSIPAKITQHKEHVNITIEDQQALQNENWDEFDMENQPVQDKALKKSRKSFQEIVESAMQSKINTKNCLAKTQNRKKFDLVLPPTPPAVENKDIDIDQMDVIQASPESPRTKRAKLVFGRCFEPTFSETYLGQTLAPNSDSE